MRILLNRNRLYSNQPYLKFPFLIIEPTTDKSTDFIIKMQDDLCKGLLNSNNKFQIYGDLEVIKEIPAICDKDTFYFSRREIPR